MKNTDFSEYQNHKVALDNSPYEIDVETYVDYKNRKILAKETPRDPVDYAGFITKRNAYNKAHRDGVQAVIEDLKESTGSQILDGPSFTLPNGSGRSFPDIGEIYRKNDGTYGINFYEYKTGNAGLTPNQLDIYPHILDGSALFTKSQADRMLKDFGVFVEPGDSLGDIFGNNISYEIWQGVE